MRAPFVLYLMFCGICMLCDLILYYAFAAAASSIWHLAESHRVSDFFAFMFYFYFRVARMAEVNAYFWGLSVMCNC